MSSTVLWVVDSNYYGHGYAEINNLYCLQHMLILYFLKNIYHRMQ